MAIQSDLSSAQQKATALKKGTNKLLEQPGINNDTQTTVAGNSNAQEAITAALETATKISQAVSVASGNLQSVAKDFEALDQTAAKTVFSSVGE